MKRIDTSSAGAAQNWPADPYPGLRPFLITEESDESLIFFGRKAQIHDLLDRLGDTHFMAVLGPSGCGKSSLVKAGLIPALSSGLIYEAGANWVAAEAEPGSAPIRNLSKAIAIALGRGRREGADEKIPDASALEERLQASTAALVDLAEELPDLLEDNTNLLVLVDQFEELFREDLAQRDEDAQLINLLLNVFNQRPDGLYVVITMRTDYLEQCATFHGLPEALNQSQFLTPRLNAQQLADAISGPVELRQYGGKVEPRLARKILSEMTGSSGYDPDLLPLMQHALFWMWRGAVRDTPGGGEPVELTLEAYQRLAGDEGLQGVLSKRADDIFLNTLSAEQQHIAETMFRLMSEIDDGARRRRRVTTPEEIAASAGVDLEAARAVIDIFADPAVNFIRWKDDGATLDVTHESLIRKWDRLDGWAQDERTDAEEYRDMEKAAAKWAEDNRATLTEAGLLRWEEFQDRKGDVAQWARRYGDHFQEVTAYVDLSRERVEENKRNKAQSARLKEENRASKRRARGFMIVGSVGVTLAGLAAVGWYTAFQEAREADAQRKLVEQQAKDLESEGIKLRAAEAEVRAALEEATRTSKSLEQQKDNLTQEVKRNEGLSQLALRVITLRRAGLVDREVDEGRPATALRVALDTRQISTDAEKPFHVALARAVTAAPRPSPPFAGRFGSVVSAVWSGERGDWQVMWQNGGVHAVGAPDDVSFPFKATPNYHFIPEALSADLSRALVYNENRKPIIVNNGASLFPVPLWGWAPGDELTRAQFFGDGEFLVTLSDSRKLVVWDVESGDRSDELAKVDRFAVSPDGLRLATVSTTPHARGSTVQIWDLFPALKRRVDYQVDGAVNVLAWGQGEDEIFAGLRKGSVLALSPNGASAVEPTRRRRSVTALAHHAAFGLVAMALGRNTVEVWKMGEKPERLRQSLGHEFVSGLQFAPDGKTLLIQSASQLQVFDVESGALGGTIGPDGQPVALSENGQRAVTIVRGGRSWIWSPATGQRQAFVEAPKSGVNVSLAALSPDARVVVSGYEDGTLQMSDASTGKQIWATPGSPGVFRSVLVTQDRSRIVVLVRLRETNTQKLMLLDGATGAVLKEVAGPYTLTNHGVSRDGSLLYVQTRGDEVEVWDTQSGNLSSIIKARTARVYAAALIEKEGASEQKQLALAERNVISIWNLQTGERIAQTARYNSRPRSLAVDRSGTRLISVFSNRLALWNLTNLSTTRSLVQAASAQGNGFYRAMFDRSGASFSVVSRDFRSSRHSANPVRNRLSYWTIAGRERSAGGGAAYALVQRSEVFNQVTKPKVHFAWPSDTVVQTLGLSSRGVNLWSLSHGTQPRDIKEDDFAVELPFAPYWADFTSDGHLAVHHRGGPSLYGPDRGSGRWSNRWDKTIGISARGYTRALIPQSGYRADLSPDGKHIVIPGGAGGSLSVIDVRTGRRIASASHGPRALRNAVFGPDGKQILTYGSDGLAKVWTFDGSAPSIAFQGEYADPQPERKRVLAGMIDPSGRTFVTSAEDNRVSTWLIGNTNGPISTGRLERESAFAGFTKSGACTYFSNRSGGFVRRKSDDLDQPCGEEPDNNVIGERVVPGYRVLSYSVDPQGEFAVMSAVGTGRLASINRHLLAIYSLKSGKPVAVWVEPSRRLYRWAAWSKDGSKLAVPWRLNKIRVITRDQLTDWNALINDAEWAAKPELSENDKKRMDLINISEFTNLAK